MGTDSPERVLRDVLQWSPRCREHFFPWRSKAAEVMRAHSIAEAGITECHPGYRLERRAPRFHLLVYPMEGTGEVFDLDGAWRVRPGEVLIAPALKPFGYHPAEDTWRFMWFHLPNNEKWKFVCAWPLTVRKTRLTAPLQKACEEFLHEFKGRTESHREASALYIQLISCYIMREMGPGAGLEDVDTGNRLDHLIERINSDLTRRWNVAELASILGVSSSHLHRLVRQHFRISPMKLVARLRMERAEELLIMHDVPQRVIGEMVGYQDEFAFLVAFKRFSGVTPKEFRKRR